MNVGDIVAEREIDLTRERLVRYAGASGDFNPIHYRDDIAASVGLDGVLAHGMLTLGAAVSPVTEWLGSRGYVVDAQARFTRPVIVDPQHGAHVTVIGKISEIDGKDVRIDLRVLCAEKTVLGRAQMVVRFL